MLRHLAPHLVRQARRRLVSQHSPMACVSTIATLEQPSWLAQEESVEAYVKGGYRPTIVGEHLHGGRYRILGKLGFGDQSIVWVARDVTKQ